MGRFMTKAEFEELEKRAELLMANTSEAHRKLLIEVSKLEQEVVELAIDVHRQ